MSTPMYVGKLHPGRDLMQYDIADDVANVGTWLKPMVATSAMFRQGKSFRGFGAFGCPAGNGAAEAVTFPAAAIALPDGATYAIQWGFTFLSYTKVLGTPGSITVSIRGYRTDGTNSDAVESDHANTTANYQAGRGSVIIHDTEPSLSVLTDVLGTLRNILVNARLSGATSSANLANMFSWNTWLAGQKLGCVGLRAAMSMLFVASPAARYFAAQSGDYGPGCMGASLGPSSWLFSAYGSAGIVSEASSWQGHFLAQAGKIKASLKSPRFSGLGSAGY